MRLIEILKIVWNPLFLIVKAPAMKNESLTVLDSTPSLDGARLIAAKHDGYILVGFRDRK